MATIQIVIPGAGGETRTVDAITALVAQIQETGFYEEVNVFDATIGSRASEITLLSLVSAITSASGGIPIGGASFLHKYQENLAVPSGVETTVLSYTVPALKVLSIQEFSAWADVDAEYFLKIDGVQFSGGRTSIADPTCKKKIQILATDGQIVTIRALRQSPSLTLPFKAELIGVLNDA